MCTILTFTPDLWDADMRSRVALDCAGNPDGFSLLLLGKTEGEVLLTQAMAPGFINALLDGACGFEWTRAFLHTRMATGRDVDLAGCHGWQAIDAESDNPITVFHNGILSSPVAKKLRVDSKLIANLIEQVGVEATAEHLLLREDYANVFLVDTVDAHYTVVRSATGRLHTDGKGNYSTNAVGTLNQPVPAAYCESYVVEQIAKTCTAWDVPLPTNVSRLPLTESQAVELLLHGYGEVHAEFLELCEEMSWDTLGLPTSVEEIISPEQRGWYILSYEWAGEGAWLTSNWR